MNSSLLNLTVAYVKLHFLLPRLLHCMVCCGLTNGQIASRAFLLMGEARLSKGLCDRSMFVSLRGLHEISYCLSYWHLWEHCGKQSHFWNRWTRWRSGRQQPLLHELRDKNTFIAAGGQNRLILLASLTVDCLQRPPTPSTSPQTTKFGLRLELACCDLREGENALHRHKRCGCVFTLTWSPVV